MQTDVFYMKGLATGDLLQGSRVEDIIHTWHRATSVLKTSDITYVEFDFRSEFRIFSLIFVTHVVLFFLIKAKKTGFP